MSERERGDRERERGGQADAIQSSVHSPGPVPCSYDIIMMIIFIVASRNVHRDRGMLVRKRKPEM